MRALNIPIWVIKNVKNWQTYFLNDLKLISAKTITLTLNNKTQYIIRPKTIDQHIINEIYMDKIYNPKGFEIKSTDTVLDIGAQIGIFSIYAAKKAKKGQVLSFEPTKENFSMLKENVEINKLQNVKVFRQAVGNKNGKLKIYLEHNTGGHTIINNGKNFIEATQICLDSIIKEQKLNQIDFLKLDCEGSEYSILFNTKIENLKKIKKISMEYHKLDKTKNAETLKTFLEKNGFQVETSNENIGMLHAIKK